MLLNSDFDWSGLKISLMGVVFAHVGYFVSASQLPSILRIFGYFIILASFAVVFYGGSKHFKAMFGNNPHPKDVLKSIECSNCHKGLLTEDITGDICPYCSHEINWKAF